MKNRRSPPRSQARSSARSPARSPARGPARPPNRRAAEKPAPGEQRASRKDKARWVIGIHSCEEALKIRPQGIRELWLRDKWDDSQALREIQKTAERAKIKILTKPVGVLEKLGSGHQGVALAATESPEVDWANLETATDVVVLILDGIEDPHNLGAIIRTAWLSGVKALFIPADRAVGLTPTVCKVASGGAEHVAVETEANLPSVLEKLKELGFWSFGLSEKGERFPWDFQLKGKVAWVVGSEGSGIRVPTERACDELVRIPQIATGSSYNASIATAMALMETSRQMGSPR